MLTTPPFRRAPRLLAIELSLLVVAIALAVAAITAMLSQRTADADTSEL
ncbi:MAG TPA: hypothetical protein VLA91_15400 [Acidimicrobiia bacterium]|nr:hypothetical protein [Acidimicrobiia bacterium]